LVTHRRAFGPGFARHSGPGPCCTEQGVLAAKGGKGQSLGFPETRASISKQCGGSTGTALCLWDTGGGHRVPIRPPQRPKRKRGRGRGGGDERENGSTRERGRPHIIGRAARACPFPPGTPGARGAGSNFKNKKKKNFGQRIGGREAKKTRAGPEHHKQKTRVNPNLAGGLRVSAGGGNGEGGLSARRGTFKKRVGRFGQSQ